MKKLILHSFEELLLNRISNNDYFNNNRSIVIAVSGGKDSMALLHAMIKLNQVLKKDLVVVHINHHLRKNSIEDELFVKEFCDRNDIEIIIKHLNPKNKLKESSTEEWAREARYNLLYEISSNFNSCSIMTGHHGNDQIETILFRLSQGSGIAGLRGIHSKRGRIMRPLLSVSKNKINDYIQDIGIKWTEDYSNKDLSIPRNFLRHKIVLPWEKENPNLLSSFDQISKNAQDVYESLIFAAKMLIPQLICNGKNGQLCLDEQQIKAIPPYLLSLIFKELTLSDSPWRRHTHYDLYNFVSYSKTGQIFNIDNKWKLLKDRDKFILECKDHIRKSPISVTPDKKISLNNSTFIWKSNSKKEQFINSTNSELIDAKKIRNKTLTLRLWNKGDRFKPIGMKGSKKLSDYFIDEKIDIFSKMKQWLLLDGDKIIWVCGRRISDDIKVTSRTTKFAKFIIE